MIGINSQKIVNINLNGGSWKCNLIKINDKKIQNLSRWKKNITTSISR